MKNTLLITLSILLFSSCATLNKLGIKPSALETALALKQVLNSSTFQTIKTLKNLSEGNSEMMPKELNTVLAGLGALGYGDDVEKVKKQISNASGIALNESEGIITDAIKEISFKDAAAIVLGGEDAATGILKNAMYSTVKKRYSERLGQSLEGQEAVEYWPIASRAYNLFSSNKVDTTLPDFLAERAVDALFLGIGKNEKAVRADYKSLGNQVVNKVFDYYADKK